MMVFGPMQPDSAPRPHNRRNRRPKHRELFCPAHPEQRIEGNGKKYFLHLISSQELHQRGFTAKWAQMIIHAYPVLVLSNEWLEELYCPKYGRLQWCHINKHDRVLHTVRWAPRELWEKVAHVDPVVANPSVSQYTRREARRNRKKRTDGLGFTIESKFTSCRTRHDITNSRKTLELASTEGVASHQ